MKKGREARTHRLTVRLPERLHQALVPIAEDDSRSVSDWIVVTLAQSIATYDAKDPVHARREIEVPRRRRRTVSKKEYREKTLIIRIPPTLHTALVEVAEAEQRSISLWVSGALERAIAERAVLRTLHEDREQ